MEKANVSLGISLVTSPSKHRVFLLLSCLRRTCVQTCDKNTCQPLPVPPPSKNQHPENSSMAHTWQRRKEEGEERKLGLGIHQPARIEDKLPIVGRGEEDMQDRLEPLNLTRCPALLGPGSLLSLELVQWDNVTSCLSPAPGTAVRPGCHPQLQEKALR